jgi:hypothetical protein
MTAHTSVAVGLSIGSTMLAAVTATGAVTGPPLLTRAGRPIDDISKSMCNASVCCRYGRQAVVRR